MIKNWGIYQKDIDCVIGNIPNIEYLFGKTVFITGVTGLICSAVADVLFRLNCICKANIKVVLGGRDYYRVRSRFQKSDMFRFVNFNALESREYEYADYIIYGAGNATSDAFANKPIETILANIVGLNSVLASAVNCKSGRVLYISSSEVYGPAFGANPIKEENYSSVDMLDVRSCYPSSKQTAELLCKSYEQEYNFDTVIVRPSYIYGPTITDKDNRVIAQFMRNAVNHENIILKSIGTQLRSYCYVLDCASAILTVLLNGESGQAYNIANDKSNVMIRDMAKMFADTVGTKVICEAQANKQSNLLNDMVLNSRKLQRLGWNPMFDTKTGIEHTISCFCDHQ